MRKTFKGQHEDLINHIRNNLKSRNIENKDTVAYLICQVELVTVFLLNTLGKKVPTRRIWELFALPSNSDRLAKEFNLKRLAKLQAVYNNWDNSRVVKSAIENYQKEEIDFRVIKFFNEQGKRYFSFKDNSITRINRSKRYLKALDKAVAYQKQKRKNIFNYSESKNNIIYKNRGKKEKISLKDLFNTDEESEGKVFNHLEQISESDFKIDISAVETEKIKISIQELKQWALEMDQLEKSKEIKTSEKSNWFERIKNLEFKLADNKKGLKNKEEFTIEGATNVLGALSVGKSTFITVVTWGLVKKRGKKISIVLYSTGDVFETRNTLLNLDLKAVPLMSVKSLSFKEQVNKQRSAIKEKIAHNALLAFKDLNYNCILKNLAEDEYREDKFKKTNLCDSLYVENDFKEEKILCPFVNKCPKFTRIKNLNQAQVIITTINSAVQSSLPQPYSKQKIKILEYINRRTHLSFFDEVDRSQHNLDSIFSKEFFIHGGEKGLNNLNFDRELKFKNQGSPFKNFSQHLNKLNVYSREIVSIAANNQIETLFAARHKVVNQKISGRILAYVFLEELIGKANYYNNIVSDDSEQEIIKLYEKLRDGFVKNIRFFLRKIRDGASFKEGSFHDELEKLSNRLEGSKNKYIDIFMKRQVKELFEVNSNLSPKELKTLKKLSKKFHDNWENRLEKAIEKAEIKFKLFASLLMLEYHFKYIIQYWSQIRSFVKRGAISNQLFYLNTNKREYDSLFPQVLNLHYGFEIIKGKNDSIKIKYKDFQGVGRWLLLGYDKLYRDLDGIKSNCIFLSGTSKFAKSPKFHLRFPDKEEEVSTILLKNKVKNIGELIFKSGAGNYTKKISGTYGSKKEKNLKELARLVASKKDYQNNNLIEKLKAKIEKKERRNILIGLGSYKSSNIFADALIKYLPRNEAKGVYSLVKSGHSRKDYHIESDKIEQANQLKVKILCLPFRIGRGYNILTEIDKKMIAKFSIVLLAQRPYYIPYSADIEAAWINSSYLKAIKEFKLEQISDLKRFKKQAEARVRKVQYQLENMKGYASLNNLQRDKLLADFFVQIFQFACRAIRGHQKAIVYPLDSSFAPGNFNNNQADSKNTSMLLGWQDMLNKMLTNTSKVDREIYQELYQNVKFDYKLKKNQEG